MIIRDDIQQGTQAWIEAKIGIPSPSNFDRIVTAGSKPRAAKVFTHDGTCTQDQIAQLKRAPRQLEQWNDLEMAGGFLQEADVRNRDAMRKLIERGFVNECDHTSLMIQDTPPGRSSQWDDYRNELVGEWFTGEPDAEWTGNRATEHGQFLEPEAFKAFSFMTDLEPRKVGFVYKDESRMVGCSPDGLIFSPARDGEDWGITAGLELKCPFKAGNHVKYFLERGVPQKYMIQVQGCLWVTGLPAWYFQSYLPGQPELIVKVEPDPIYQAAFDEYIPAFVADVLEAREYLLSQGFKPFLEDA